MLPWAKWISILVFQSLEIMYISVQGQSSRGVHIGTNVIIGANAVVIHDIPDNCVAVGMPAKSVNSKL